MSKVARPGQSARPASPPKKEKTENRGKSWIGRRLGAAGRWPGLAVLMGIVRTASIIAVAAILSWTINAMVMTRAGFVDLWPWWILLAAAFALRAYSAWLKDYAGKQASTRVRREIRTSLVDRIHELGPAWRLRFQGGDLVSRLLEQVDSLDGYVAHYLPQQRLAVLAPALILAFVFPLNWACGLLLLLSAPLIPFFMTLVGWGTKDEQDKQLRSLSRMSGFFLGLLRGLPSLRLVNAHHSQDTRVAEVSEDFRVRTMKVLKLAFLSSTTLEFLTMLSIAFTAIYLGFSFMGFLNFGTWGHTVSLFEALFILILAPEFYMPLRELGTQYHARAAAFAAADRLSEISEAESPQVAGGTLPPPESAPRVDMREIDFSYVPGIPVLRGLDLSVGPGEAVAIVGPSGAGKTTLLHLVLGQVRPSSGRILIDGRDLGDLDIRAWREKIGWISQHPRAISGSLADNLRVAKIDVDETGMKAVLDFAGLSEWFASLPQGLETRLGEGGRGMSGGQLRRLALARAALRPATLLLLDEPTASLDRKTEDLLIERLSELRRGKTLILLSHHEETLSLVDRVFELPTALASADPEKEALS